jgi:hypothetical protein
VSKCQLLKSVFRTRWNDGCDKAASCTLGNGCPNLDSHYSFRFCRPTWSPVLHRGSFNPGNPPGNHRSRYAPEDLFLRGCPEVRGFTQSSPSEGGLVLRCVPLLLPAACILNTFHSLFDAVQSELLEVSTSYIICFDIPKLRMC